MFVHSSSVQDAGPPNTSSHTVASSPITSSQHFRSRSLSPSIPITETELPPLQREEVGAGCDVLPVSLHHQGGELWAEGAEAQPSALQVSTHLRSSQFNFICTQSATKTI